MMPMKSVPQKWIPSEAIASTEGRTISASMRCQEFGRHDSSGRVGAHAAGVRPGIAVADTFVIL
jgi:hypothetical protein